MRKASCSPFVRVSTNRACESLSSFAAASGAIAHEMSALSERCTELRVDADVFDDTVQDCGAALTLFDPCRTESRWTGLAALADEAIRITSKIFHFIGKLLVSIP